MIDKDIEEKLDGLRKYNERNSEEIKLIKEKLKHVIDNVNELNGKQIMEKIESLETVVLKNLTSMYISNKETVAIVNKLLRDSEDRKKLNNIRERFGLFDEQMIKNLVTKERIRQELKDIELLEFQYKLLIEKVIDTIRIYKERLEEFKVCSECGYKHEELADICEECGSDLLGIKK